MFISQHLYGKYKGVGYIVYAFMQTSVYKIISLVCEQYKRSCQEAYTIGRGCQSGMFIVHLLKMTLLQSSHVSHANHWQAKTVSPTVLYE